MKIEKLKPVAMPEKWYKELVELCYIQSHSKNEKRMVLYLASELTKMKLDYEIDATGNILVTKGQSNTYPCVVSHMDTVHKIVKDYKLYFSIDKSNNHKYLWAKKLEQLTGIGGDDKCGIFACLYFLKTLPQIKVVFFTQEETGCVGSSDIDKSFFSDCRYILELDRRNGYDFIDSYLGDKCVSQEFGSEIGHIKKQYRYKSTTGIFTDCMKLWNNRVGISCVNISCGYYKPHSDDEYIDTWELWHSIKFTEKIIKTLKHKRYESLPPEKKTTTYKYTGNYTKQFKCIHCGRTAYVLTTFQWNRDKIGWECKDGCDKYKDDEQDDYNNYEKCWKCGHWARKSTLIQDGELFICKQCKENKEEKDKLSGTCSICGVFCFSGEMTTKNGKKVCLKCSEKEICVQCGEEKDKDKGLSSNVYSGWICYECWYKLGTNPKNTAIDKANGAKCSICQAIVPKDKGKYVNDGNTFVCERCVEIYQVETEI